MRVVTTRLASSWVDNLYIGLDPTVVVAECCSCGGKRGETDGVAEFVMLVFHALLLAVVVACG